MRNKLPTASSLNFSFCHYSIYQNPLTILVNPCFYPIGEQNQYPVLGLYSFFQELPFFAWSQLWRILLLFVQTHAPKYHVYRLNSLRLGVNALLYCVAKNGN